MNQSKEYWDGYRQGVLSIPPHLGYFAREECCKGYIDGSAERRKVLCSKRPLMREEALIKKLLRKV